MLKKELQQAYYNALDEIQKLKKNQIPCGHRLDYCPNCGTGVLISNGSFAQRNDNNRKRDFYCSNGHSFTYRS